jgi:hypothetical protein
MPIFREPPCPQCGQVFPTRQLWKVAPPNRFYLLNGKCGIACPHCGMHLRVFQSGVAIFSVAVLFMAMGLLYVALATVSDKDAVVIVLALIMIPAVILQVRFAPCFARVGVVTDETGIEYPLAPRPMAPETDGERDEHEFAEAMSQAPASETLQGGASAWKCASCGEDNPGEFDVCWKCQRDRPAGGCST